MVDGRDPGIRSTNWRETWSEEGRYVTPINIMNEYPNNSPNLLDYKHFVSQLQYHIPDIFTNKLFCYLFC